MLHLLAIRSKDQEKNIIFVIGGEAVQDGTTETLEEEGLGARRLHWIQVATFVDTDNAVSRDLRTTTWQMNAVLQRHSHHPGRTTAKSMTASQLCNQILAFWFDQI